MSTPSRLRWRWADRDYGFRFLSGGGKRATEHYQGAAAGEFYVIPAGQRQVEKARLEELSSRFPAPTAPRIVPSPWRDYDEPQKAETQTGIALNLAGCLDQNEINERETNGVARAKDFIVELALRETPEPLTLELLQRVHELMFSDIYPWAGKWRTVSLHKGDGPTKWPLPPGGMQHQLDTFAREVLSRTPFLSEDTDAIFTFLAEFMGEYLALHPFREGNGRSAFILGELILLQNGLLPLHAYDSRRDQARYYAACEEARISRDYTPLAALLTEWQAEAQAAFTDAE